MNALDFISEQPKVHIFGKLSNKTNLGGILTLLYIIALILISVAYMYDFFHVPNYEYSYFYKNINREYREGLKEKYNLNPITNFSIEVRDSNSNVIDDRFIFTYFVGRDLVDFNKTISVNIDELKAVIFYKCSYDNPDNICLDYISSTFELNIYYESLMKMQRFQ